VSGGAMEGGRNSGFNKIIRFNLDLGREMRENYFCWLLDLKG
jgi:hypothetical protein